MGKLLSSLLLTAALTFAAPVTYSSLSSWQAAGPQDGTIGFESAVSAGGLSSVLSNGFNFTPSSGFLLVDGTGYIYFNLGAGPALTSPQSPAGIDIAIPANVFGIGFIVGSSGGVPVTVIINGDTAHALTIDNPTNPPPNLGNLATFWGFRSDVAVTSLSLAATGPGNRVIIDNFTWGGQATQQGGGGGTGPTETPEVSSGLLIGGALVLVPLLRRAVKL
jgi:hypothetical protein